MRVYLGSIGCRLNQSELEILAADLRQAGHEIVASPEKAQAAIINSCTVTNAAEADSRQLTHKLARAGVEKIFLTGCWASVDHIHSDDLPANVTLVGNTHKHAIVRDYFPDTGMAQEEFAARVPLPGKGRRTRAFIKVQEGCDYFCTFCITRIARGKSSSRPLEEILHDIQAAELADVKEIVLTGTQLGGWGKEYDPPQTIADLVKIIFTQSSIPFLRLSSLEPWDINNDFYALLDHPRFCNHLHLPLQSGCGETLKRMGRKMQPREFARLIASLRAVDPDIAITTDIVVGFPGESKEEFEESLEFVRRMHFAGGHVFRYSARRGTPAASFPNQVDEKERKRRNGVMREVLKESGIRYRASFLQKTTQVLWERARKREEGGWIMEGISTKSMRIRAQADQNLWNQVSQVKLVEDTGRFVEGLIEQTKDDPL
jgi:threonylcarbamoyladenosine tRNA methylthiotransferase MtaB